MLGWTTFEDYDVNVITLLEEIQIEWLARWISDDAKKDLSIILNHYQHIYWFLTNKAPSTKDTFNSIKELDIKTNDSIDIVVQRFLPTIEDWLVYVTDPELYDALPHNSWETNELLDITDFENKVVIDIGAGTGSQTFRIAHLAKHIHIVEPIGNLRKYLREKAIKLNRNNVFVSDGLMTEIPFPDNFTDIVVSGHVFGDEPNEEFEEVMRVIKPGGMMILMPGNSDKDNDIHTFLMDKGCQFGRFEEPGDGFKRKYWVIK